MSGADTAEVLSIFLLSAVKFLLAPGTAIATGFTAWQAFAISASGGCTGITFFYFFGTWVTQKLDERRNKFRPEASVPRKRFNRRNRLIIRVKHQVGFIGLIILTPAILSIPIGSVVAAKFYRHLQSTYPLLLLSTCVWSIVLVLFASQLKSWLFA